MTLPDSKIVEGFKKNYLAYSIFVLAGVVGFLFVDNRNLHTKIEDIHTRQSAEYLKQNVRMVEVIERNTAVLETVNKKLNN